MFEWSECTELQKNTELERAPNFNLFKGGGPSATGKIKPT
jgi:hypothetical protein